MQIDLNTRNGGLPPKHSLGLLSKVGSSKELRLRENYIINRDNDYNRLKGQVHNLINSPKFNRFISLKKTALRNADNLVNKYPPAQGERKKSLESSFNRRQLYFMRQRRPEHNSPLKIRGEPQKENGKEKAKVIPILVEEQENAMLIKQLVTHVEQPRRAITPLEDPYSPRSAGKYYIAEAVKQYLNIDSPIREHLFSSLFFLQLLNAYALTPNQPQTIPLDLPQKDKYKGKITVVFDLDETLVHCFEEMTQSHEIELPVRFHGGGFMIAPLNIRPGARELLAQLSQNFQLMVFTASHECYADAVIDYLDPRHEYIQHRLYRHNCVYIDQGYYVKDLRLLGRDLARVVLVDNAAYSYSFQVDNGIPILPYYEGTTDYELKALRHYLFGLSGDVREKNRKTFKLSEYARFNDVEELVSELYM